MPCLGYMVDDILNIYNNDHGPFPLYCSSSRSSAISSLTPAYYRGRQASECYGEAADSRVLSAIPQTNNFLDLVNFMEFIQQTKVGVLLCAFVIYRVLVLLPVPIGL